MTIRQTIDHSLRASGRLGWQSADLKLRKAETDLATLEGTLKNNGRDEIVVQTNAGDLYVLDALSLKLADSGESPEVGDEFTLGGIEGRVVHIDVDRERWGGWASIATMGGTWIGGPLATKAVMMAADIPHEPTVGLAAAIIAVVAGFIGGALVNHPKSDDSELSKVSTTLASSKSGDFAEIEAQLSTQAD